MKNNALLKTSVLVLLACGLVAAFSTSHAIAQSPAGSYFVVRMVQGQESRITSDFVAEYDEGKEFRLSLVPHGYDRGGPGFQNNLERLTATLVNDDGSTQEQRSDASGTVVFHDVGAGLKGLVVTAGGAAYGAMAVYLQSSLDNAGQRADSDPAAPPPENATPENAPADNVIAEAAAKSYPVNIGQIDVARIGKQVAVSGVGGQMPTGRGLRPIGDYKLSVAGGFRVALLPNGTLVGRVIVPELGFEQTPGPVRLSFYRNGIAVADTVSSADGSFYVSGLGLGPHTVVAYGPPGHASFAFDVSPNAEQAPAFTNKAFSGSLPVATRSATQVPNELVILLIPPTLMPAVRDVVARAYATPPDDGMGGFVGGPSGEFGPGGLGAGGFGGGAAGGFGGGAGGGFGGGAGGGFGGGASGGGGFGGIGGLGGLLGIAGLAAGIAALASEDDGFNTPTASLISP